MSTARKDPNNKQQNKFKNVLRFATLPVLVTPVVQRQRLGWEKVCSNFFEPLVQFQHNDTPSYKSAFERQRRNKTDLKDHQTAVANRSGTHSQLTQIRVSTHNGHPRAKRARGRSPIAKEI